MDKYPGNYSTYLLPIIIHIRKDERLQYKNSICLVNRRLKEIGKKLEMDLSHSQSMEFARDMFMFSFYTRGMSFVDMAFLKKTDLNNGMLTYRRKKTGQLLSIRWEKCMQDIVDKYPGNFSTYLPPIIIHIRKDERLQYKNSICLVNRRLKEIGKKLGYRDWETTDR